MVFVVFLLSSVLLHCLLLFLLFVEFPVFWCCKFFWWMVPWTCSHQFVTLAPMWHTVHRLILKIGLRVFDILWICIGSGPQQRHIVIILCWYLEGFAYFYYKYVSVRGLSRDTLCWYCVDIYKDFRTFIINMYRFGDSAQTY